MKQNQPNQNQPNPKSNKPGAAAGAVLGPLSAHTGALLGGAAGAAAGAALGEIGRVVLLEQAAAKQVQLQLQTRMQAEDPNSRQQKGGGGVVGGEQRDEGDRVGGGGEEAVTGGVTSATAASDTGPSGGMADDRIPGGLGWCGGLVDRGLACWRKAGGCCFSHCCAR